jgi:hypothetical protein
VICHGGVAKAVDNPGICRPYLPDDIDAENKKSRQIFSEDFLPCSIAVFVSECLEVGAHNAVEQPMTMAVDK